MCTEPPFFCQMFRGLGSAVGSLDVWDFCWLSTYPRLAVIRYSMLYVYVYCWFWLDSAWNSKGPCLRWGWECLKSLLLFLFSLFSQVIWFTTPLLGWFQEVFEQLHPYTDLTCQQIKVHPPGNDDAIARFGKADLGLFWQPIWCLSLTWSATGDILQGTVCWMMQLRAYPEMLHEIWLRL